MRRSRGPEPFIEPAGRSVTMASRIIGGENDRVFATEYAAAGTG